MKIINSTSESQEEGVRKDQKLSVMMYGRVVTISNARSAIEMVCSRKHCYSFVLYLFVARVI